MLTKRLHVCLFLLTINSHMHLQAVFLEPASIPTVHSENSPSDLAKIVQSKQTKRARLCNADHQLLRSLANTEVEVMLAVPDEQLEPIAGSQEEADSWIGSNVAPFLPATKITHIVVGSGVLTTSPGNAHLVVPAMRHLHSALAAAGLDDRVNVSSPLSVAAFNPEWSAVMEHLLQFLEATGSPFFLTPRRTDSTDAAVEAVYNAMRALNCSGVAVIVTAQSEELSIGDTVVYHSYGHGHANDGKRRSLATGNMFCVAIQGADPTALQAGLNWACGPGHADCTAIQPGGPCYKQNNLVALASYAYNDYYHRNSNTGATCSFNGTATTTPTDPSSGQCIFAGSTMAGGPSSSNTPMASAPSGLSPPTGFGPPTFGFGPSANAVPFGGGYTILFDARRALYVLLVFPFFFF